MSPPPPDSESSDRLRAPIASARVVIAVALAMFPFGWPGTTPAQTAITLALAGVMLGTGIAQLLPARRDRLWRMAVGIDALVAVAAVWTYPQDHNRLLFGLALLAMLEAAAVLDGRRLLAAWLLDIGGYAALEASHPGGDGVSVIIRISTATVLAVAVHVGFGRVDARRERLARLTAGLEALVWEIDPSGRITYVNDHAERLFGGGLHTIERLLQLPDGRFVAELFEHGAADAQLRVRTADGRDLWLHVTGSVTYDRRGRPAAAHGVAHDITEIRQAEQRFRSLAEHAPIGIFRCDPEGWASYVNPFGYAIAGITGDDLDEGRGWADLIHPDDRPAVLEAWANAAQRARPFELTYRFLRPTGEARWVVQLAVPVWDDHGRLTGYEGTTDDVTDRLAAEEALRASEQRLRDVFDTVDLLAAVTSVDGRIVYINEAFAATVGRHAAELTGGDWIETFSADPDDAEVVEHFFSELRAGRIVRKDENWIDTPHGPRLIAWSNTILRNSDGSVFGAASMGQDITEQRTAEDSLRASEERFRMLSQHAPVGIFQTDAQGGCTYVNERWMQMTGLGMEQAAGTGWGAAIHPEDHEHVAEQWQQARENGRQLSIEFRFQRPDGVVVWTHAIAVAIRGLDDRVTGFIGTCADITERREAEAAVVESERRLRTITDNMTDVIFVYGMDHRLQWVTPSVEGLTGYSVAELFERNTLDDVHPDDEGRMLELWRALFHGEGYTGAEFRIVNRDGAEKWCWSAGSPIYDGDGVQIGVQIRDADISLRKQAELRVRESEQRSRAIIETTSDAFFSADGGGVVQEWNRAAELVFGVPRAEAIGSGMFELVVSEAGREALERGLGKLGTEGEATVELVGRNRESGDFAAEMRLWPMLVDGELTLNAFVRDITERKMREERYTFMAYHDPLTGLPNRAMLEQHLELVLVRARHDGSSAALLYLDIDRFKQANDSFGHEAGDQLLCDVAGRLKAAARSGDLVVRLGGDEFVVVLGDLPAAAAADVAKAVADRVHEGLSRPFDLAGTSFASSASIGIALFPGDGDDAAALLTAADTGMYVSKRAGRGRTSFALGSRWAA